MRGMFHVLTVLLGVIYVPANAATISSPNGLALIIEGTIEAGDAAKFSIVASELGPVIVYVNSDGGHLGEAMKIGRSIRNKEMAVMVATGSRCASACVFILAAGVSRIVEDTASIVIHRPFLTTALPDGASYDANHKRMASDIRNYLADMNVPQELGDRMVSIPPHRGEALAKAELSRYMLNAPDPAHEQKHAAKTASKLGIPLAELNRREAVGEAICSKPLSDSNFDLIAYFYCLDAILKGRSAANTLAGYKKAMADRSTFERLDADSQDGCLRRLILGDAKAICPPLK